MKCPNCPETSLIMSERQGVEIDYCPVCRGVWLNRGELDKLIERTATPAIDFKRDAHYKREYEKDRKYDDDKYYYKKKKSLLAELFD